MSPSEKAITQVARQHPESPDIRGQLDRGVLVAALDQAGGHLHEGVGDEPLEPVAPLASANRPPRR